MKRISLMVVAALISASMFANSANLLKGTKKVNGIAAKTEMKKAHKQKEKGGAKDHKTHKAHKAVKAK